MKSSRLFPLALIMLLGCAGPSKFERYTQISRTSSSFISDLSTIQSETDSVEIGIRYVIKDTLDSYFKSLSHTGAGETIYKIGPLEVKGSGGLSAEELGLRRRAEAMKQFLLQRRIVNDDEIAALEPHLSRLDAAILSQQKGGDYNFAKAPQIVALPEKFQNPYDIQEYQAGLKIGVTSSVLKGSEAEAISLELQTRVLSGQMGLDVFEIYIKNSSSQNIYIEPKDIWLVDDAANQQNMLGLDYFERLYLDSSGDNQRPLRYANIERTILTSGPIFPGQARKALLPFYPISASAKSVNLYWSPSEGHLENRPWTFMPKTDIEKRRYLNVGILVKTEDYTIPYGMKNAMIFMRPMQVVDISGEGGFSSAKINIDELEQKFTLHAIAASSAKPGEKKLKIFYGEKIVDLNTDKKKQGPEFVQIRLEPYLVDIQ